MIFFNKYIISNEYSNYFVLKHIRAKLLLPQQLPEVSEELDIDEGIGATNLSCSNGKPLKAIMPAGSSKNDIHKSSSSLNSYDSNEYAIDITHVEKFVQDSDSIILDQK
jgi:hypothetical protein